MTERTLVSLCAEFSALDNELQNNWLSIPFERRWEMCSQMSALRRLAYSDFGIEDFDIEVWAYEGKLSRLLDERQRLSNRNSKRDTAILSRLETFIAEATDAERRS